jgi:hypothetical protein
MVDQLDVRFGSKADMCGAKSHVCFTPKSGTIWRVGQIGLRRITRKYAKLLGTTSREFVVQDHSLPRQCSNKEFVLQHHASLPIGGAITLLLEAWR